MLFILTHKKAQVWSLDFIVAIVIFITSFLVLYNYILDLQAPKDATLKPLEIDSRLITTNLLSSGSPKNWTTTGVTVIGIVNNGYLNVDKLKNFSALTYQDSKALLKTRYDFYLFFEDKTTSPINISGVVGIGKASVNSTNLNQVVNPLKIYQTTRLVVYNNQIVRMVLYIWQ